VEKKLYALGQLVGVERLQENPVGPEFFLDFLEKGVLTIARRECEDRAVITKASNLVVESEAIDIWKHEVEDREVGPECSDFFAYLTGELREVELVVALEQDQVD
jgi:hypothetical protein